ncbi:hypothetical protein ACLKA6_018824 [Drosophila palustris]
MENYEIFGNDENAEVIDVEIFLDVLEPLLGASSEKIFSDTDRELSKRAPLEIPKTNYSAVSSNRLTWRMP